MHRVELAAAFVALIGLACLAMAPQPGPAADGQQANARAVAPKPSPALDLPAARPCTPKAKATTPKDKATTPKDKNVALGDRPAKPFPKLDQIMDQVTCDLQRKIDEDAKRIEQTLMRQSQFRLGP